MIPNDLYYKRLAFKAFIQERVRKKYQYKLRTRK